jgi:polar amino acid transport system substrate-binding protein
MTFVIRWGRVAVLLFAVALTGGACKSKSKSAVGGGGSQTNTVEEGRSLKTVNAGKLTVCADIPDPPFTFQESGDLRGIDIDLVKAVTGRMGIGADFKDTDRAMLFDSLKSGQCDMAIGAIPVTDDRKGDFDFTQSYFQLHQAMLVKKGDEAKYHDLPDVNGHPVGVANEQAASFTQKQKIAAKAFPTGAEAVAALKAGQVDAVVADEAVVLSSAMAGDVAAVRTFSDGPVQQLAFAVVKGKKALLDTVNAALTQVRSDDSYRTILTNYLGSTAGQS